MPPDTPVLPSSPHMTTGETPAKASGSAPRGGIIGFFFSGPNLPFTLAIIIGLAALGAFFALKGDDAAVGAATATSSATTLTTTTSSSSGPTTTTDAPTTATSDAAATTQPTTSSTSEPATTSSSTSSSVATTGTTQPAAPLQALALQQLATGLPWPIFATSSPIPDDERIFVLERAGRIRLIDPDQGLLEKPFLDLLDVVGSGGIENGLLGLVFHPDFATNGRLFVYFTNRDLDSRLVEYRAGNDPNFIDPSTAITLFGVPQEGNRHRAGMLQFGPDGNLYMALGDGGLGGEEAQDLDDPRGSILRFDVDGADPYAIPQGNPFAAGGGAAEIWVYGLRNPWRFHIDAVDGVMYIGDVGQATWEEINVVDLQDGAGTNFGWPRREGTGCYIEGSGCAPEDFTDPVTAYNHDEGCSVTGGYVYRGQAIPELTGHYFYSDWCTGFVRSFRLDGGSITAPQDWSADLDGAGQVASFGVDSNGELLVVDSNGSIYRVVPIRSA